MNWTVNEMGNWDDRRATTNHKIMEIKRKKRVTLQCMFKSQATQHENGGDVPCPRMQQHGHLESDDKIHYSVGEQTHANKSTDMARRAKHVLAKKRHAGHKNENALHCG